MNRFVDNYRHRGMRQKLIEDLKSKGITDNRILSVMSQLPRHFFIDKAFADWAYRDVAFQIESDQTISQPFTVAFQTELLNLQPTDVVLEIGTGSGYQACVLHDLCKKVYTIERQENLFYQTDKLLKLIGYGKIRNTLGDGFAGMPRFAPFDKILVTCGAAEIPIQLAYQLKDGGIMIVPVGTDGQEMIKLTKKGDTLIKEEHGAFKFVPMLHGLNRKRRKVTL